MILNSLSGVSKTDRLKAVSVSLPTWEAIIGYEEGEDWVRSRMKTGYPRYDVERVKDVHRSTSFLGSLSIKVLKNLRPQ